MSLSATQRRQALSLYRRLLKTGQSTFAGDQQVIAAWHQKVRTSFKDPSQLAGSDEGVVEAKLREWEDVITILKKNIVQGQRQADTGAYRLRITPESELGSNESVKEGRKKQLEALAASKGSARTPSCGSSQKAAYSTWSPSMLAGPSRLGPNSNHARRLFSSSSIAAASSSKASSTPIPAPVPHFPSTTILSDGSSIEMHTTSPRHVAKLTRDMTNHPLWNPSVQRRGGVSGDGSEEDAGRLGRFRRRFADDFSVAAEAPTSQDASSAGDTGRVRFGEEDLEWMSQGGRQARAGTPISKGKAGKGKGKK